jgi:hypothetical protein
MEQHNWSRGCCWITSTNNSFKDYTTHLFGLMNRILKLMESMSGSAVLVLMAVYYHLTHTWSNWLVFPKLIGQFCTANFQIISPKFSINQTLMISRYYQIWLRSSPWEASSHT